MADSTETDGFDPTAFARLYAAEPGNFWFENRNALLIGLMRAHFADMRSFLEVGCGTGFVLNGIARAFRETEIVGCDAYDEGIDYARRRVPDRVSLHRFDGRHLPFAQAFDVVGAFDVLEHVDDDGAALEAMRRALRPGGGLIITVPQHPTLWSAADEYARHVRRYTRSELRGKVEHCGFRIVRMTSFASLLLPIMLTSRLLRRSGEFDPMAEFRLSGPVNAALGAMLVLERAAIRSGFDFPFGGSLVLVARLAST
jgi:SAM-dependent methyltransferase